MASGGVASPTDPLDRCQYSDDEIRAAVEEADRAGHYVAAHCHPKEAVRRAAAMGVKSIEHATLIDQPEFALRARVLLPIDVFRSACAVNAELLGQSRQLGCIRQGAMADILVVDGNPLEDISTLGSGGERLSVIMKEGCFHKRTI